MSPFAPLITLVALAFAGLALIARQHFTRQSPWKEAEMPRKPKPQPTKPKPTPTPTAGPSKADDGIRD